MSLDSYEVDHSKKIHRYINIYDDDDILEVIDSLFLLNPSFNNRRVIEKYYMSQDNENAKLAEDIEHVATTLRNALKVLNRRSITNIGGRVFHTIIPEKYYPEISLTPRCYLIQVWRSNRPS